MNTDSRGPTAWRRDMVLGPQGSDDEDDERRCTARAKGTGQRCANWAVRGARVCRVHGGAAAQVKAAAQRRLAAAKVESDIKDVLAFESLEGVDDPVEALSRLAAEALANQEAAAARVNRLKTFRYSAHGSGAEQTRAEVTFWERERDRAAKLLKLLADSGFEERRVRMNERQGALIAEAIRAILGRLMLSTEQQALVGTVVPEELRRLAQQGRGAQGATVRGELQ